MNFCQHGYDCVKEILMKYFHFIQNYLAIFMFLCYVHHNSSSRTPDNAFKHIILTSSQSRTSGSTQTEEEMAYLQALQIVILSKRCIWHDLVKFEKDKCFYFTNMLSPVRHRIIFSMLLTHTAVSNSCNVEFTL